ncbi:MAG TPA: recA protein [Bdellovibrionales bacterium]|nr:recA protein [Bdellovibrionales bacterium]
MDSQKMDRFNFLSPEEIKAPEGCPTGHLELDQFLISKGLPKGGLSALCGDKGLGATSLWLQMAQRITAKKSHVACIENKTEHINPWALKKFEIPLSQFFWISPPKDLRQKLWVLSELCSLDFFESIACPLEGEYLKDRQLLQLRKLARLHQVAVVFFTTHAWSHHELEVSLHFQKDHIRILRARHRPTPHLLERSFFHAHTLSEFAPERKALRG